MINVHALRDAASGVGKRLMPIEASFDATMAQTADLLAYLPTARLQARLPMSAGHDAMGRKGGNSGTPEDLHSIKGMGIDEE
jgi:hypothetical protein